MIAEQLASVEVLRGRGHGGGVVRAQKRGNELREKWAQCWSEPRCGGEGTGG